MRSRPGGGPSAMKSCLGTHDVLWVTLDTLRYDVAVQAMNAGLTPNLARAISRWDRRHNPGNFTFAAHAAMFAGFLPTPSVPGPHERLFALRFEGSETTGERTLVLDGPSVPEGFAAAGYHTICVGGVGFFNMQNELGRVLPGMFDEAHWDRTLGVTDPESAKNQVDLAIARLAARDRGERVLLFINVSALHQPNWFYLEDGPRTDSPASQAAALGYVDSQLGRLFDVMRQRAPVFAVVCSDHGTAYGEDGFTGHRVGHEVVWTVPYADFELASLEN